MLSTADHAAIQTILRAQIRQLLQLEDLCELRGEYGYQQDLEGIACELARVLSDSVNYRRRAGAGTREPA